jgi:hypothetical protein
MSLDRDDGPTLDEEVVFLRQLVDEFPALGVAPQSLVSLDLRIRESDVRRKLAAFAARSQMWHRAMRAKASGSHELADLLVASKAYDGLGQFLSRYGLEVVRIGSVEDIILGRLGHVWIGDLPAGTVGEELVPVSASIHLVLARVGQAGAEK